MSKLAVGPPNLGCNGPWVEATNEWEADHLPTSIAKVKNEGSLPSISLEGIHDDVIKIKDNFNLMCSPWMLDLCPKR